MLILFKIPRKYLLFLFFSCLCMSNDLHGQLLIGPSAGIQLNWINYEDDVSFIEPEPVVGYNVGMTVVGKVDKRFFLQAEFLYSRKGKRYEGAIDPDLDFRMTSHYLELPIVYRVDFKARIGNIPEFKYYLGLGPNLSYWLKSSGTVNSAELVEEGLSELEYDVVFGAKDNPEPNELVVDKPNRIQLGVNFAVGLSFQPPSGNAILVDLRYQLGHSFFARSDFARLLEVSDFADPLRARTNGARVSVSYLFDTKISQRKKGKSTNKGRER
ncbi:PorT family protein [Fulvivirga sp. M361]|uniref:porin family protein n=1 Tax=Fulvivirga sp. M361 TaxID=2594266 RepID=UPI00117AFC5C|nr:porin family protein [Fulvivirga sp. M361]TRX51397.1 PorT family protein [Fulvivirga sp. M361]